MRSFLRICSHLLKRSLVCLQLDKITHIYHKGFETLSWLLVSERFNQCINSIVFKYVIFNALIIQIKFTKQLRKILFKGGSPVDTQRRFNVYTTSNDVADVV